MKAQIEKAIKMQLANLDNTKYHNIIDNIRYESGLRKVINMIYNRLTEFENWSFENAMTDVELTLSNLGNE